MTYIFAGVKASDSTLVTKALLAKQLGQSKFEHKGKSIEVYGNEVKTAVKVVLEKLKF